MTTSSLTRPRSTSPMRFLRKHNKRANSPEQHQQHRGGERRTPQMRRSSLPDIVPEELCLLNASWGDATRGRDAKRSSLQFHLSAPNLRTSSRPSSPSLLINSDEMKSLTMCLWSTSFAGTVDPRFHSEYVRGAKNFPTAC